MPNPKFQLPSLKPIDFSLTAGTSIPAPPESPPPTSTPGGAPHGGPLNSNPTTPYASLPGSYPPSPDIERPTLGTKKSSGTLSPTSPQAGSPQMDRRPSSVRRFLGLRSLNSTYNKSTDSLSAPYSPVNGENRPSSPSVASITSSANNSVRPSLNRKRSTGWFSRRRSGIFRVDEDTVVHDAGDSREGSEKENAGQRSQDRLDSGSMVTTPPPQRSGPPPPQLPDFSLLGTKLDGGSLGGDDIFKDIK